MEREQGARGERRRRVLRAELPGGVGRVQGGRERAHARLEPELRVGVLAGGRGASRRRGRGARGRRRAQDGRHGAPGVRRPGAPPDALRHAGRRPRRGPARRVPAAAHHLVPRK